MINAPTITNCNCSTVAACSGRPTAGANTRSAIGRMKISAAPKNEPVRLPRPPTITMNRIKKLWLTSNTAASAPPYQKNTSIAPATPQ